ncbi:unnamed protein product [Durusdinium trenchii]
MQANIPTTVLATIDSAEYQGGGLIALPESKFVKTPTAKELSSNIMWLKPLVTYSPSKVLGAYFLTDAWLMLDRSLGFKLFRPQPHETRMKLAAYEACKAKKCMGALRSLWRSSKTGGHDQNIRHLKSFLRDSPGRRADDSPVDDEAGSDPASEPEPVPAPVLDDDRESCSESTSEEEAIEKDAEPSPDSESDCNSLTARTLRLGESPGSSSSSASESPDHRDSQVSSGWMGKAMSDITRQTMAAEAWERKLKDLLLDIKFDLQEQLHVSMEGAEWDQYSEWCRNVLTAHGDSVYAKLADAGHFKRWIFRQKSQPGEDHPGCKVSLDKALRTMNMEVAVEEEDNTVTPAAKRPRTLEVVSMALDETPPPVVGPQTAKTMSAVKTEDKMSELGGGEFGEPLKKFHSYDLDELQVPQEARPRVGQNHLGRHGYTLKSRNGAVVECLLKTRAFVIKKASAQASTSQSPRSSKSTGQVTWSKFGGAEKAWLATKCRAGW